MTEAEKICKGIDTLHSQAVALAETVLALQRKLESEREAFETAPLTIVVEKGDGAEVVRGNPLIDTYRNVLTSYMQALRDLEAMVEAGSNPEQALSSLDVLRNQFKVVA